MRGGHCACVRPSIISDGLLMPELPNTLVVVALRAESAGVFEAAGIPVLYCGVGKVNAATDMDCAVVDMEAYALAKACWYAKAPFACAKYVSDGADHAAADDWQQNQHKAADEFLRLYMAVVRSRSGAGLI